MPRQKHYTDGTPSREIEDDWETTGEEEMNELYEECRKRNAMQAQKKSVLDVRDRLVSVIDLITVCREALNESHLTDIKTIVVDVLHFHVEEQLKIANWELRNV